MKRDVYDWLIVYTRPGMERKVSKELNKKNIESYCPLNKVERKWWALKRTVELPLFASYVFVKASPDEINELRKIEGVINVLYWLGKPAVVKDYEIAMLKNFLCNHLNVSVERTAVKGFEFVSNTSSGTYVMQSAKMTDDYKMELPTIGYKLTAGSISMGSKVVAMQPVAKVAEMKLQPQYSTAG